VKQQAHFVKIFAGLENLENVRENLGTVAFRRKKILSRKRFRENKNIKMTFATTQMIR
jgi:hypothetical protein